MLHPLLYALLFFFILLFSLPNSQSSTTERDILLSLKQHWGNPSSLYLWNSTSMPCDWPHILCISGSTVGIYLYGMNIQGSFPSTIICQLNNLASINLYLNNLSGSIPVGLSTCSKLETLDLSRNHLTGKIPGELFSMKMLRSLNLRQNMLSEMPTSLVPNSLEFLDLPRNHLTGKIPGELFSMKMLRSLNLRQNMLSEMPTSLVPNSLEFLDLSSNHLNGSIPEDIGNLFNLGYLDLSWNSLIGSIPEDIGNLHNLSNLYLSRNSLSGPIPARLLQLSRLNYLSLAFNSLTSKIPGKLFLFGLNYIDLSHNHLSGTIPKAFEGLLQLENMDVSHNQLSGDIWGSVSHLSATTLTLNICSNKLSGRIPNKLVKKIFVDSCFDQDNLCSDVLTEGLPTCSSDRCSDYTIRPYINCSSITTSLPIKSNKNNYIIITCGAVAGVLIGLVILLLAFRCAVARRKENDGEEWSMISFQRLEFNKWEILGGLTDDNLIGNGGSGKVYRVITRKGQRVAVKSIRDEQKQGHRLEKQFLAEVKILGEIRHNNIVTLLCCIRGKTTKLIVYEYTDKQCLHNWLHGNNKRFTTQVLQWERRLKIAIGAAQGLCYMHHNRNPPIVHRDIKSSNILVDSEFNAKIADFGLAKMLASEEDPETASAIVGTFGYIAPEYGNTRKVNVKSDVYSFGVVLLELTTGREAVTRDEYMNRAQLAHKHQREGNLAMDALDEEIKDPRYREAATTIFKLGLDCTLSLPSSRPSMKDILQILQRCSENSRLFSHS